MVSAFNISYRGSFPISYIISIVSKGNSFNLMKMSSKRRRSKMQIQQDKDDAERKRLETELKLAEYELMQQEIQRLQQKTLGIR